MTSSEALKFHVSAIRKIVRRQVSILFWKVLKRSWVFRYWYDQFLNELMFDLEVADMDREGVYRKYYRKLTRLRSGSDD